MLDYMRVIEAAQNFNFTLYLFKYTLLFNMLFVQNFDRHFVVGNFVEGD